MPGGIDALSQFGLALPMFLAGYEIDFAKLRGDPLKRAGTAWLVSVVVTLGVGALVNRVPLDDAFAGPALSGRRAPAVPHGGGAGRRRDAVGAAVPVGGAAGARGRPPAGGRGCRAAAGPGRELASSRPGFRAGGQITPAWRAVSSKARATGLPR
ncbi:hypothetical protein ACWC9T_21440 [Kitasatospora sp. NPDC001159]